MPLFYCSRHERHGCCGRQASGRRRGRRGPRPSRARLARTQGLWWAPRSPLCWPTRTHQLVRCDLFGASLDSCDPVSRLSPCTARESARSTLLLGMVPPALTLTRAVTSQHLPFTRKGARTADFLPYALVPAEAGSAGQRWSDGAARVGTAPPFSWALRAGTAGGHDERHGRGNGAEVGVTPGGSVKVPEGKRGTTGAPSAEPERCLASGETAQRNRRGGGI